MTGGTEAFPDLGRHCQLSDCHQLDFLPFQCDGCRKVFCVEHRSYKSHECPKSDHNSRKVVVCEICSASIETTGRDGEQDQKLLLEKHAKSGNCDPRKKKKPTCPVRRCKEILTFSNTSTCKTCQIKVCLKHRFPADHVCRKPTAAQPSLAGKAVSWNDKFMAAFASREGKECGKSARDSKSSASSAPSVRAY
ncbi:zinc finger AN1 domain-containing stress-associated protein 12-like [Pyrus ussuriensis x Pyrus communis]|uniref:Zinc finger AN1 domain-containing stress-associated protein 12-like n=1 Tax=Pyrus ussuriensis x Pyrus communis TaxID=2448454 RepID=A0A5N5I4X1_9ROSA|nr:zinc finger AN1 domain-containing stress-associated protein 12-like [Pyrus ussuriensis x Pyrus communis]